MIKNYFKIAWRNLWKNKLYSFINIGGLGLGLAICMLIMLYVAHEYSYDKFNKNNKRIFSVSGKMKIGNDSIFSNQLSFAAAPILKQEYPQVESFVRTQTQDKITVIQNMERLQLKFAEEKFMLADSNFFSFFTFQLVQGRSEDVLKEPFSVVITARTAKKYFGTENPIGKLVSYNNKYQFRITGVAADVPSNSSIDFDFVASISSIKGMAEKKYEATSQRFQFGSVITYFLLHNASDEVPIEKAMNTIAMRGTEKRNDDAQYNLTSFGKAHLENNFGDAANLKYLKIFPVVALLILLLALINYMSLATARATTRAKEIGVRKVMGAARSNIAWQFYTETALYAILSFIAGCTLYSILQPWFYSLLQLNIDSSFLYNKSMLAIFLILLITTIFGAGVYPSIFLSSYKPISIISGKMSKKGGGASVRKFFSILQFTISVALVISGFIINRQLYFMRHTETGINRENVIMIPFQKSIGNHFLAFREDIRTLPAVKEVSIAHYPMYKGYDMFFSNTDNGQIPLPEFVVDRQFVSMMGLQWKIPPGNAEDLLADKKVILNETAVNKLNLPQNPLGSQIDFSGDTVTVAAVVKDFNFETLQKKIEPLCMFVAKDTGSFGGDMNGCLFAKFGANTNLPTVINSIQKIFDKYDKESPFTYSFMDDAFEAQYKAEDRLANLFSVFTVITIIIACMGLFGLALFSIQQRTKEIGIRKVIGSSVAGIAILLSRDFIKPVIISIVIASPIAWWVMTKWLQAFAYRINISWWMFALTAVTVVLIALLTVIFQAIKAAIANPVKSLRVE